MNQIYTHHGLFHSDEVTAIALLKVFYPDERYEIKRVHHQTLEFPDALYVIDTGRVYDGKTRFDHHHFEKDDPNYGLSSAGLIWRYIGQQEKYPNISKFIDLIDQHDTGIRKASPFEYPSLISSYNTDQVYSDEQYRAFTRAIDTAMVIIRKMKDIIDGIEIAEKIVNDAPVIDDILFLETFHRSWSLFVDGEKRPEIHRVVWQNPDLKNWYIQVPNMKPGEYGLNGTPLHQDDAMDFVHKSGFLAVAKDFETALKYLAINPLRFGNKVISLNSGKHKIPKNIKVSNIE